MVTFDSIQSFGMTFLNQMKEVFLGENSRLWWAWLILAFPAIGALVGAYELKKGGQPITVRTLFRFVFPKEIYKSASFKNDVIIVFSLYVLYALIIFLVAGAESKVIVGKMIQFFGTSDLMDRLQVSSYKKSLTLNLGTHLFFTFLVILAYDFGFTMLHYAFHKFPFLWRFHKVHHSAEHLTPLTVARFHLVEYVIMKVVEGLTLGFIFAIFFYLLPKGVDMYKVFGLSIFGIMFSSIGVFRHSHIWISYGFMNYIFSSPAMHQIHHSKEERHIDKNLAQIFSFWDYLLGTLYVPKTREIFAVGLAGEEGWNEAQKRKALLTHLKA
ncbi:MAG: sterol desaturase family protein [Bdellovibrionaceae bacterium]|nr:sterol desaturase family protein [Bdellovibrio sp.]